MGQQYSHLPLFERQRLFNWYHYDKKSIREISRLLSRSHSTISREIKITKHDLNFSLLLSIYFTNIFSNA